MSTSRLAAAPHVAAALFVITVLGLAGLLYRRQARLNRRVRVVEAVTTGLQVQLDAQTALRIFFGGDQPVSSVGRLASVTSLPTPVTAGGAQ